MTNFLEKIWAAPMRARTITLTVAILSTIATLISAVTEPGSGFHTTPEQALLISSIGAGLYAFVRALQKASAGESLKAIFATSEMKGVAIVCAASIATAAKGVVPPAWAGAMAVIATGLTLLSRSVGRGSASGGPPLAAAALAFLLGSTAFASPKSPQLGGSTADGLWSWQPAVAVSAVQCDLKTFDCVRVGLGAGYGLVYKGLPVNVGVAGYLGAGIAKNAPNAAQGNLLFSVADLGAAGPGLQVWKDPSTGKPSWGLLGTVALNLNIGGTTTYIEHLVDVYERPTPPDAGPSPAPADAGAPDTQTLEVSR